MGYPDWKVHGEETLAAYLPEKEFQGLLEKRIAVPPDCAALLIRDGQLVGAFRGANFSVGGLWQGVKNLVGGRHALRLLIADLKPFPILSGIEAFTLDKVRIQGEVTLELQLDPEKPANILGLLADGAALTRADLYARIRPHLQERVLIDEIVRHDAADLRANAGLQDRIQAQTMKEVGRIAGDLGVLVRAVSVNWGLNEEETQAIRIRDRKREDEYRDFEYERARRELEREAETTVFRLRSGANVEKVKASGESDLKRLLLENELALEDARDTGARIRERKRLQGELELAKDRRLAAYDQSLGDAGNDLERTKIDLARRRLEMAFEADRRKGDLELRKLEQMAELDVGAAGVDLNLKKLRGVQQVELEKERFHHDIHKDDYLTRHAAELEKQEAERRAELEKLKVQAAMDPDQILALQAGLSPEVAKVFAERARAGGVEREALLREMLALSKESKSETAAQAQAMFDRAVDRLAQVGSSLGAAAGGAPGQGFVPADGAAECPKCHFRAPPGDRFCKNCGHQMRT